MDLDSLFEVADSLNWGNDRDEWFAGVHTCCGNRSFTVCYKDGHEVCNLCGLCQYTVIFDKADAGTVCYVSNYKRLHHFHERVSQFLIQESTIPEDEFESIQVCLRQYRVLNKSNIRSVLRSLKLQKYIEKWLQIIWRVTKLKPPTFPTNITCQLDFLFQTLQMPFDKYKPAGRKNFLNYNYTFHRFFQLLGLTKFCMFFPLIKSKQKIDQLDSVWKGICLDIGWQYKPLVKVKEFAIKNPLFQSVPSL